MCMIMTFAPLCVPGWGLEPHSVSGFQSVEVVNLRHSVLRARHLHVSPAGCPLLFSRTARGGVLSCIHLSGEERRGVEPPSVGDALQIAPVCFPHTPLPFPVLRLFGQAAGCMLTQLSALQLPGLPLPRRHVPSPPSGSCVRARCPCGMRGRGIRTRVCIREFSR